MMVVAPDQTTFETGVDMIDATSNHRPDTDWRVADASGHTHQWHVDGQPASGYSPLQRYDVPSLRWVRTGTGYFEDGEPYAIGHHECAICGEPIEPRYTADTYTQYVPGLRWFRINGQSVTREDFEQALRERGYI